MSELDIVAAQLFQSLTVQWGLVTDQIYYLAYNIGHSRCVHEHKGAVRTFTVVLLVIVKNLETTLMSMNGTYA